MKNRMTNIELYRLVFTLIIAMMHMGIYFSAGYIGVDFFLNITGYFVAKEYIEKHSENSNAYNKIRRMLLKIYPYILFTAIIRYFILNRVFSVSYGARYELLDNFFKEILLQHMYFPFFEYNSPLWYLSALFIAMPLFYIVLFISKRFNAIAFMIPLIIYSYMMRTFGTIGEWATTTRGGVGIGIYRELASLCVGMLLYYAVSKYRGIMNKYQRVISLAECILLLGFFRVFHGSNRTLDVYRIVYVFILLMIALSGSSVLARVINRVKVPFISELSAAIYVSHAVLYRFSDILFSYEDGVMKRNILCISSILMTGIVLVVIVRGFAALCKYFMRNKKAVS